MSRSPTAAALRTAALHAMPLVLWLALQPGFAAAPGAPGPLADNTPLAQGTNRTCSAAPADSRPLYLRGSMNGWTAQDDFEFLWDCDAWYLNVHLQGEYEFKIADAHWSAGHGWSTPQPGSDARSAGLMLRPDLPGAPAVQARFDGAHTLRVSPAGAQRVLQIQVQHFAD
ncbi:MAG: hypothetical protein ACK5DI_11620, partial [Limnohabitans sp.]